MESLTTKPIQSKTFTIIVTLFTLIILAEAAAIAYLFIRSPKSASTNVQQNAQNNVANTVQQNTAQNTAGVTNTSGNTNTVSSTPTSTTSTPTLVSATPQSGEQLSGTLSKVSLTFNTALDSSSTIKVSRKSYDVTSGSATFSADKKTIEVGVTASASDTYTVNYTACTQPSSACSINSYTFHLDYTGQSTRLPAKTPEGTK